MLFLVIYVKHNLNIFQGTKKNFELSRLELSRLDYISTSQTQLDEIFLKYKLQTNVALLSFIRITLRLSGIFSLIFTHAQYPC